MLDGDICVKLYLDYNAGTGYQWNCTVEPEGVLSIASQETTSQKKGQNTTGGPLTDVVTLWSSGPGTATVTCKLQRPWESKEDAAEIQTYVFTVDKNLQISFDEGASDFVNAPEFQTLS